ncbi:MAG: hypothetical protein RL198_831 [Actinomycetota bacterium]|jgi:hypothetical protein
MSESAEANSPKQSKGKGRPTPPRKVSQAQRKRPLVGDRSKEARAKERERVRAERQKIRDGMMAGDERYLTSRDRGPQRKLVRDYVDGRFTAGETVLPALFVVVLLTFIDSTELQIAALFGMWGLFGIVALDAWITGKRAKKLVGERFGEDRVEKGIPWYAAMRSIQMRALRIPKPQLKRGEGPGFEKPAKKRGN